MTSSFFKRIASIVVRRSFFNKSLILALSSGVMIFVPISMRMSYDFSASDDSGYPFYDHQPAYIQDAQGTTIGWWEVTAPKSIAKNSDADISVSYHINTKLIEQKSSSVAEQEAQSTPLDEYQNCLKKKSFEAMWNRQSDIECISPPHDNTLGDAASNRAVEKDPDPISLLQASINAPNFKLSDNPVIAFDISDLFNSELHSLRRSWTLTPIEEGGPFHVSIRFLVRPVTYRSEVSVNGDTSVKSGDYVTFSMNIDCINKHGVSSAYFDLMDTIFRFIAFFMTLPFIVSIIVSWLKKKKIIEQ